MARSFHRRHTLSTVSEINLTNMIDLGFVLLIIFMISTPLIDRGTGLDLQVPVGTTERTSEPRYLEIAIDARGSLYVDGQPSDAGALSAALRREAARGEGARVVNLRADGALPYYQVTQVIDLIKEAGLVKLSLETRKDG